MVSHVGYSDLRTYDRLLHSRLSSYVLNITSISTYEDVASTLYEIRILLIYCLCQRRNTACPISAPSSCEFDKLHAQVQGFSLCRDFPTHTHTHTHIHTWLNVPHARGRYVRGHSLSCCSKQLNLLINMLIQELIYYYYIQPCCWIIRRLFSLLSGVGQ